MLSIPKTKDASPDEILETMEIELYLTSRRVENSRLHNEERRLGKFDTHRKKGKQRISYLKREV